VKEPIKNDKRKIIGYVEKFGAKILVYNHTYRKVGEIRFEFGKQVAYDTHLKRIAVYEEKMNVTKDARLVKVGKGNLLVQIILQNDM